MAVTDHGRINQIKEGKLLELCSDPMWRLNNLYWVRDKDGNAVPFHPWSEQLKFLNEIWYRNIIPKARQRGFSTVVQLVELDACIFVPNTAAAIIAQDLNTSTKIFRDKIKFAWDRMPGAIQEANPLTKKTESEYNWANESFLYVATSARGGTLQYLHVSELGSVAKRFPQKVHEIVTGALPTVDKNGVIVIESTVESPDDAFSEMVKVAQKHQQSGRKLHKQQYKLHFASWWDAPEYEADPEGVPISKADNAYFYRIEGLIGRKISKRKRAWYVLTRDNAFAGDQNKMFSQYPSTLEEAFSVASEGKWLAKQMAAARNENRILKLPYRPDLPVLTVWDIGTNDDMCIWVGQENGPWVDWINYFEGSGEHYSYYVGLLMQEGYHVYSHHLVPHDADNRIQGEHRINTAKDILEGLKLRNIITVPRIAEYTQGVEQLRTAFPTYRFDEENCADGIKHLDGYSKVWDEKHGRYTSIYAKNGHQHAPDALRQHAQYRHNLRHNPDGRSRPKRRNKSGMAA
ncbi:hypothetical protein [Hoeflea poritis]|uniref:Terminase n=1 Tax=Hoeflea poritis TaxID=2993659 RepID=A0ABT4VMN8_9HYPH|nr:hypothetical protein [Hoeflea poritis]MDA4845939.1 hypothetical protein [Hoeflea poritis]